MKDGTHSIASPLSTCFGKHKILWLNLVGGFVVGLDRVCPIAAVACLDDGLEYDFVENRSGLRFLSRERKTGKRIRTPDPCTDEIIPALRDEIDNTMERHPAADWIFVCPRGSRTLEDFACKRGKKAVCPPSVLYDWLYDKANFFSGLEAAGLPRLPGRWLRAKNARFAELRSTFGLPFVVQTARSQSGAGTSLIRRESDLAAVFANLADSELWIAPFAGPLSLNINAFAMDSWIAVGYPNIQLVGLDMVGARPFSGYCGNDYTSVAGLPCEIVQEAQDQTERLGRWLISLGYRGIFGLDFVMQQGSGKLFPVDLNPRWQGSTVLETQAMLRAGRIPLAAAEIAYTTGSMSESDIAPFLDDFRAPIAGSQLYLAYVGPGEARIDRHVSPGIYVSVQQLEFRRPGLELADCATEEEVLLCGGIVRPGTCLVPGSRPARVASLGAMVNPETLAPLPWTRRVVSKVYEAIGLTPPRDETW